jgi:LysM repeat protein
MSAAAQAQEPAQPEAEQSEPGYLYTVQEGDSWDSVAQRTGVPVDQLQAANPDSVRSTGWLLNGEQLFIPTSTVTQSQRHTVGAGESWASIAARYGIPVSLLRAANPGSVRTGNVLHRGEVLVIPPLGAPVPTAVATPAVTATGTVTPAEEATEEPEEEATEEPTEEATAAAEETATAEATPEVTEEPAEEAADTPTATSTPEEPEAEAAPSDIVTETVTETVTVTDTVALTDTETLTDSEAVTDAEVVTDTEVVTDAEAVTTTDEVTSTADITSTEATTETAGSAFDLPVCPEQFADYPEAMADAIDRNEDAIGAVLAFLESCEALVEDGSHVGDLTGDDSDDLVVVYQNPSQEQVFVEGDLAIFNSAAEGLALNYRARAAGEVRLLQVGDLNGDGQIDVVWVDTTCGASTCFDTVNVRSWDGSSWADWTDGTITMAYAEIESTDAAEEGQGDELVLSGGIYGSVGAGPQRSRTETWASLEGAPYTLLEKAYSASECLYHTVLDANRAFLDAPTAGFEAAQVLYEQAATDEALIKCWVRNDELAELRGFSFFRLALVAGYQDDAEGAAARIAELTTAYPGSVYDEVGQLWLEAYETEGSAAAACAEVAAYVEENPAAWELLADYGYTNPSFEAADVCPVLELGDDATEEGATEEGATEEGEESPPSSSSTGSTGTGEAAIAASPDCPADLAGYAEALPSVLAEAAGDQTAIAAWLQGCGVLTEDLGAVVLAELDAEVDDDGLPDAIVYPTIITDLGYGPDGAQGAVFVFHAEDDGSYSLIANPEIYGQPAPLAVDDLNSDGRTDIAWTVTGCSTFCVTEVQMWTWDGDAYLSVIQPGATIAEGVAAFGPVVQGDPGDGQQLVLTGGLSGMAEGGLAVPHTEIWQSIDGGLYRRLRWEYDRSVEGNNCLGLRLVEANVSLQASEVVGYEPAIAQYTAALDPDLKACSVLGLDASEELELLRGLASFRLVQAQALSGDLGAAEETLAALAETQPDGLYTQAAGQWLEQMIAEGDPAQACIAIAPIFAENPQLWQITDHFGYNHPALAAGQVCYAP